MNELEQLENEGLSHVSKALDCFLKAWRESKSAKTAVWYKRCDDTVQEGHLDRVIPKPKGGVNEEPTRAESSEAGHTTTGTDVTTPRLSRPAPF